MKQEESIMPAELKEYFRGFLVKILENLSSVKVWFFILPFIVSTCVLGYLAYEHVQIVKMALADLIKEGKQDIFVDLIKQMEIVMTMFIAWCTFNVSLAGTIVVVRETFKVKKLIALNDEAKDNSEQIKKMNA
jgi:hypothetical protein